MVRVPYDEFGLFGENAAEQGLPYDGPPTVARTAVEVGDGRRLSALLWGPPEPGGAQVVLLHGGAQNAHTWDTVALALGAGRPGGPSLAAVDLPGHGHSDDGRRGASSSVRDHALDVAAAVRALAPQARAVVGMSLGGLTALALSAAAPELVRRLVLVDVLPTVNPDKAKLITDFVDGPESFADFDALLARTIEHNPTRTVSSLRGGILHNARQRDDGSWVWRHARHRAAGAATAESSADPNRFAWLWDVLAGLSVPVMLVRGMRPASVVDDSHEAELRRRVPSARVEHVQEAGHSVQGDAPLDLARLIADFVPPR